MKPPPSSILDPNTTKGFQFSFRQKLRRQGEKIFPYVVAGDVTKMLPEVGLHEDQHLPPPLPDTRVLEETINRMSINGEFLL